MKKSLIILTIIMFVSFLLSTLFFFNSGVFDFNYGYVTGENAKDLNFRVNNAILTNLFQEKCNLTQINQSYTLDLNDISSLEIFSLSTDIKISSTKEKQSYFNLYGKGCDHKLLYKIENETMKIYIEYPTYKSWFSGINTNLNLEIIISEDYLNQIIIDSISGDIDGKNLKLKFCEIKTISGDIDLEEVLCINSFLKTTSGEINQKEGNLDEIKTISGDVNLESITINKNSSIETISGEIKILSAAESEFKVVFNTVSGDFNGFIGNGDEKNILFVKSTSGDLEIY